MSEIKLLPCPFCGEKQLIHRSQMRFTDSTEENMIHEDGTKKWTYIECGRCGCSTKAYCYEYQSTNKWNTRKPMDKVVEQLEDYQMWKELLIYDITYREKEIINRAIDIIRAGGKEQG